MRTLVVGVVALALASSPGTARADSVSDEVTVGATAKTPSYPGARFVGDRATGLFDLSEAISVRVAASMIHYASAPQTSSATVFQLSGGGTLAISDHWTIGADGNYSPPSTTGTVQAATIDTGTGTPAPVLLAVKTRTWSAGGSAMVEYDTAGDSNYETVADFTVATTSYQIANTIPGVRGTSAACGGSGCSADLAKSLDKSTASLAQMRFSLGITETLFEDTDVDVLATYYAYTEDPTQVGIYSVGTFGRTTVGEGIPTLPLRYTGRAAALHRFGPLGLGVSCQYGRFVDDEGSSEIAGLRVEYKLAKTFKAWLTGNFERDDQRSSPAVYTGWAGLGARLRF